VRPLSCPIEYGEWPYLDVRETIAEPGAGSDHKNWEHLTMRPHGRQFLFALAATAVLAVSFSSPGLAAGSGSSSEPTCSNGKVWDAGKKMCVPSNRLDDADLIEHGRNLALNGEYDKALEVLGAVRNQENDIALTYTGYAMRKLGRVDDGIAYYHRALALNPDNLDTREYLGEGYVAAGRVDLALAELNTLEGLCGADCDQVEQLQLAIAGTPRAW
jgi:tetratricopeptide (TPR) repeat protein